jgi:hypothetical protein
MWMLQTLAAVVVSCWGLVGWQLPALVPAKPGVTLDNFRRLHTGMTQPEVQRVLGGPGKYEVILRSGFGACASEEWSDGKTIGVLLIYDAEGLVLHGVASDEHDPCYPYDGELLPR